jgi:hypothetical protein
VNLTQELIDAAMAIVRAQPGTDLLRVRLERHVHANPCEVRLWLFIAVGVLWEGVGRDDLNAAVDLLHAVSQCHGSARALDALPEPDPRDYGYEPALVTYWLRA